MTWRVNPGCDLPTIKTPPGLQTIIDNIAQDYLSFKALLLASPTLVYAQKKADEVQKIIDKGKQEAAKAQKFQDLITSYGNLYDTCPLPKVWDTAATDIDVP